MSITFWFKMFVADVVGDVCMPPYHGGLPRLNLRGLRRVRQRRVLVRYRVGPRQCSPCSTLRATFGALGVGSAQARGALRTTTPSTLNGRDTTTRVPAVVARSHGGLEYPATTRVMYVRMSV